MARRNTKALVKCCDLCALTKRSEILYPLGSPNYDLLYSTGLTTKIWVCNEFSVQMHPLTKGFLCFKKSEKMKEKQQKCAVTYKLLQSDLQILSVSCLLNIAWKKVGN